ncbi:MAG: Mov34/MPN/PAD-1 family protein [Gemmatimonadales bacterium]
MSLVLPEDVIARIRRHAERDYPREACGLLGGRPAGAEKRVARIVPAVNARADRPGDRYLIEPEEFHRAAEALAREGLEIVGVYHSHPDHPPRPSAFDREHALPWLSYVIVEVRAGRARVERSWLLADDRGAFVEEEIRTEEGSVAWQSRS